MVKIYQQPFAHAGTKQAIPDASDPQGFVSNADGFTSDYELPDTDPNYKPIERAEFNGLMNTVTESLGEIQQFGFAKWQPITWPQGARVVEGGVVYRALTQTSQQPPHADWVSDMDALIRALGTAATRDVGTNAGDVMAVGTSGLGLTAVNDIEFDSSCPSGFYRSVSYPNPLSNSYWVGFHARYGDLGEKAGLTVYIDSFNTGSASLKYAHQFEGAWYKKTLLDSSSNQTVDGIKTFSSFPVTPSAAPTDDYQSANKKYVDDSTIGVGQTWQDVTNIRLTSTTYTNTTGKPIMIHFLGNVGAGGGLFVDGVNLNFDTQVTESITAIIPAGSVYSVVSAVKDQWVELR